MNINVRVIQPGDIERVAELAKQLGYPVSASLLEERINDLQGPEEVQVYVATNPQGWVVGWLQVAVERLLISPPFAEVRGLVVDQSMHGRGIGGALVQQAEEWSQNCSVDSIRVRTRVERKGAHKFYQGLGFDEVKVQTVFRKRLEMSP